MQKQPPLHRINSSLEVSELRATRERVGFAGHWTGIKCLALPTFLMIRLVLVVGLMAVPTVSLAQAPDDEVLAKRARVSQNRALPSSVLRLLSATSRIPIGFELIPSVREEDELRISINVMNGTVRDVLDHLVKQDPRYRWEIQDGIINVLPVEANGSILDVMVPFFNIQDVDAEDVPRALLDLSEVQSRLWILGLVGSNTVQYDGPVRDLPLFSLSMTNVTVRDILNEILRRGHSKSWEVSTRGKRKKQVSIWL